MPAFQKSHIFNTALAKGVHNLAAGQATEPLAIALCTSAPGSYLTTLDTMDSSVSVADISVNIASMQFHAGDAEGSVRLKLEDITYSPALSPYVDVRYIVLYNKSAGNAIIGWWDYGSQIRLNQGESITIDFDDANGVLKID